MSKELAKTYDPKGIEERLYTKWMDNGYFHAKVNPDKKPFTIVMPPPNVTGQLHMGHALDETMQDILIRFKRMQGYEALWQPGTDHAAIATEVKVIDKLKKEGIDKHDIGREEFLKHAWAWKEEYGGKIINQLKKRMQGKCKSTFCQLLMPDGLRDYYTDSFGELCIDINRWDAGTWTFLSVSVADE